jgi:hypothetical protein
MGHGLQLVSRAQLGRSEGDIQAKQVEALRRHLGRPCVQLGVARCVSDEPSRAARVARLRRKGDQEGAVALVVMLHLLDHLAEHWRGSHQVETALFEPCRSSKHDNGQRRLVFPRHVANIAREAGNFFTARQCLLDMNNHNSFAQYQRTAFRPM